MICLTHLRFLTALFSIMFGTDILIYLAQKKSFLWVYFRIAESSILVYFFIPI